MIKFNNLHADIQYQVMCLAKRGINPSVNSCIKFSVNAKTIGSIEAQSYTTANMIWDSIQIQITKRAENISEQWIFRKD